MNHTKCINMKEVDLGYNLIEYLHVTDENTEARQAECLPKATPWDREPEETPAFLSPSSGILSLCISSWVDASQAWRWECWEPSPLGSLHITLPDTAEQWQPPLVNLTIACFHHNLGLVITSQSFGIIRPLHFCQPNGYELIFHCNFNLHFPG